MSYKNLHLAPLFSQKPHFSNLLQNTFLILFAEISKITGFFLKMQGAFLNLIRVIFRYFSIIKRTSRMLVPSKEKNLSDKKNTKKSTAETLKVKLWDFFSLLRYFKILNLKIF